jgi:hypothetical protein
MQRLLPLLAFAAVCACSSPGIEVEHEYGRASFSGFGPNYSWLEMSQTDLTAEPADTKTLVPTPEVEAFIRQTIDNELRVKGYTKVSGDKVDFQVASRTSKKFAVARPNWDLEQYEEGGLEVFMLQPQSGDLMWRGIARAALDMTLTPTQRRERIREGVKLMLNAFPNQGQEPKR